MLKYAIALMVACLLACGPQTIDESRQATGVKIGEVTSDSAIIWSRVTENAERRHDGIERRGRPNRDAPPEDLNPRDLEGSTPGAPGSVMLRYGTTSDMAIATETEWIDVGPDTDSTHHFRLTGLQPATKYYFETHTSASDGSVLHQPLSGSFETAPPVEDYANVTFTVITGQAYRDADDPKGFKIYPSMGKLNPHFVVPTGDTVYYDSDDPIARNGELARYHWRRMYSYPTLIDFHLKVPGYWEKDDHDSYANDNWPSEPNRDYMGSFSWDEGLKIYAEHTPQGERPYRTIRWGKGLQVWIVEGRDFRSPNNMEDGPEKTIWGARQKHWLKETLLASDADWKVLVSPTPIVGPDRTNKDDNHSNLAFKHEGDEFRAWVKENVPDNFFVANGDRHWQYHSIHPDTGMHEFSCGPASDQHASGTPGENKDYHQFHRVKGGFLSVNANREGDESEITFRFHAVDGEVVYEWSKSQPAS